MATKPSTVTMVTTLTTTHPVPADGTKSAFVKGLKANLEYLGERAADAGLIPDTWKVSSKPLTKAVSKIERRAAKLKAAKKRG